MRRPQAARGVPTTIGAGRTRAGCGAGISARRGLQLQASKSTVMLGWEFYAFAVSVLLYHACDFAIQYHYHPATTDKNCTLPSCLMLHRVLNHVPRPCGRFDRTACLLSPAYLIAMAVAVLEYFLEQWLLPGAKDTVPSIKYIGLVMVRSAVKVAE
jgi:hypothetical protein